MSSFVFDDQYPEQYELREAVVSKNLNMVVCIEGLDVCIGIVPTYTRVRFGDPGVDYGEPGLIWGGLRLDSRVRVGLSLDSNLVISQRLEPEQGRGAVATMSLVFVDFDQFFSALISPGQTLDEILGNKLFTVYVGYADTSFNEDYFPVFRGYASGTLSQSGKITIQLSDGNLKRRSEIFTDVSTKLNGSITSSQTTITVLNTGDFFSQILGPNGTYDTSIKNYLRIDDEFLEYDSGGILSGTQFLVTRGSRGTIAATHDDQTDVTQNTGVEGNVIDLALKIMLSGWNGPWIENVSIQSIQDGSDYGVFPNLIRFPDGINVTESYNIRPGDYFYLTGSTAGNDGTYIVESIQSSNGWKNNIVFFTTNFVAPENPASTVSIAIRSQYDTFPTGCGVKMRPTEIDINAWESIRDTFFQNDFSIMSFLMKKGIAGKEFIEKELLLPVGLYSVTRFGRISLKLTLPPIPGTKIVILDHTNVLEPQSITVSRALNNRRFFNDIKYQYDVDDLTDDFLTTTRLLDSDSLNVIGLSSTLPIPSLGLKTSLQADQFTSRQGLKLLNRYKDAAYEIQNVKTNWGTGSLIEAGDTIIMIDNGFLQITNLETGERNLGTQIYEVIDRQIDIKTGQVTMKLLSNLGYQVTDRFGVISPTSQIAATGSSGTFVKIEDSFGVEFPGDEQEKWRPIIGSNIQILKKDYSVSYTRVLTGFSASDPYLMILDSALPVTVDDTWIVEVDDYPNTAVATDNQTLKLLFCYQDPTVSVLNGISGTQFTVSFTDAAKFTTGLPIIVRNSDWSIESDEVKIESIVGTTITVDTSLGFTPSTGQFVEFIGFIDGGGPYRIL